MIPVGIEQLDESHAPLNEPAGEQAVRRKGRLAGLDPVEAECFCRFTGKIGQLRHARLHPVGHLILADPRGDFRV